MDNRDFQELAYPKEIPSFIGKFLLYGQEQKVKVLPRFELGLPEYLTNQNPE